MAFQEVQLQMWGKKIEPAVDGRGLGPGGGCFINMRNLGDD